MAKAIMVQGTGSGVGKSLLAAGLCRLFRQDGYKVSPFKSQNMALNSFITPNGLEMGRAQVVQAEAAGVEPSVLMNPILLKPTSDSASQVIVCGEVAGTMEAKDYFAYREQLRPKVEEAYRKLEEQNDIIVIEGAGSPAEINLQKDDFVNMGMAEIADAPVLLVGDIDRGGVFASLYGTAALLRPEDRQRIKGIIINKFRGDVEILKPGLKTLEDLTKAPVVGVVPYLSIDIEDEDSLAPRLARQKKRGLLDIVVIRLPRISNFTDFYALEQIDGVSVRYVTRADQIGIPDLLVLPGTKSTMHDLRWMRQNGLEAAVKKLAAKDVPIIGICGGYQMLGKTLEDPDGAEGGGRISGIGLLPVRTIFRREKTRLRVTETVNELSGAFSALSGKKLEGYEIHMGQTVIESSNDAFALLDGGVVDGAVCANVMGSYLHGLFDSGDFTGALLDILLERKGVPKDSFFGPMDYQAFKESQYDLLAASLRDCLDINYLYRILRKETV